jgi:hypothetical protein
LDSHPLKVLNLSNSGRFSSKKDGIEVVTHQELAVFEGNVSMVGLITSLFVIFYSTVLFAKTDIYSEVSAQNRTRDTVHFTKLSQSLYEPTNWSQVYLGFALSGDSRSTPHEIYNDNYAAPLLGLKVFKPGIPVWLFTEYRYIASSPEREAHPLPGNDIRAGIAAGDYRPLARIQDGLDVFNEVYGEAVYSSRLEDNLFATVFDKLGYEKRWSKLWVSQAYSEVFAKRDRLGNYYENLSELRIGFRQKLLPPPFSMNLSAHYALGSYSGRQYVDPIPGSKSYTDVAVLFVFGSEI